MLALLAVLDLATVPAVDAATPTESAAPQPDPRSYLTVDLLLGGYQNLMISGVEAHAGHQLSDTPVWVHLGGSVGGGSPLLATGQGEHQRVAGGIEFRGCADEGSGMCAFFGEDLGYIHAKFDGSEFSLIGDGMPLHEAFDMFAATTRMGFEAGSTTARIHAELEVPVDITGNWSGDHSGHGVLASLGATFAF